MPAICLLAVGGLAQAFIYVPGAGTWVGRYQVCFSAVPVNITRYLGYEQGHRAQSTKQRCIIQHYSCVRTPGTDVCRFTRNKDGARYSSTSTSTPLLFAVVYSGFLQAAWTYYDNKRGNSAGFEGRDAWNKQIKEQEKQRKNGTGA